jgi:hypothetical protein
MLVQIPLTDDERAAVEGDQTAVSGLIDALTDVATPADRSPRDLADDRSVLSSQPARSG